MSTKNYDDWYQGWFKDNIKAPYLRDAWEAATKAAEEKFASANSKSIPCQCDGEVRVAICDDCGREFHWKPVSRVTQGDK